MPSVGDLVRVDVVYTFNNNVFLNTFGFKAIDASATFADLANTFETSVVVNTSGGILYQLTGAVGCAEVRVHDVKPGTASTLSHTFTQKVGSNSSSNVQAPQLAGVITWQSALQGRSYRGRTYLPGIPEARAEAGVLDATMLAAMDDFADGFLGLFGPSGSNTKWQFGVISHRHNNVPTVPPVWTAVTAYAVRSTVYTQRRRTLGRGQ